MNNVDCTRRTPARLFGKAQPVMALMSVLVFSLIGVAGCSGDVDSDNLEQGSIGELTMSDDRGDIIRVATFNVSMEATNYTSANGPADVSGKALTLALQQGDQPQINNIAEIIQRVRPNIILLNEFDYIDNPEQGIELFKRRYLQVSQNGQTAITYPYVYAAPVNTGVPTQLTQSPDQSTPVRLSHYGFGQYPGQYGMVVLSQYPIDVDAARSFQRFLWKDMPSHLMPVEQDGSSWYRPEEVEIMRLSSKSHWDLPIDINGNTLHVLASHPTPPVFDGKEDRNGRRNHDEVRFWKDYINAEPNSYHYDDMGHQGGIVDNAKFVIVGDLNASSVEGDAYPGTMDQLLNHSKINDYSAPTSVGGVQNQQSSKAKNRKVSPYAATHTAGWGMRADYVLPSANVEVTDSGVFWPAATDSQARLVKDRAASSDHRLVWVDILIK